MQGAFVVALATFLHVVGAVLLSGSHASAQPAKGTKSNEQQSTPVTNVALSNVDCNRHGGSVVLSFACKSGLVCSLGTRLVCVTRIVRDKK